MVGGGWLELEHGVALTLDSHRKEGALGLVSRSPLRNVAGRDAQLSLRGPRKRTGYP